jgi:hypothetical protein
MVTPTVPILDGPANRTKVNTYNNPNQTLLALALILVHWGTVLLVPPILHTVPVTVKIAV